MDNIAGTKSSLTWAVHISVILLVALWVFPTFGLLVSSFRTGDQISTSGWWRALTTKEQQLPAVRVEGTEAAKDGGFAIEGKMFANAGTAVSRWGTSSKDTTKYAAGEVATLDGGQTLTVQADGSFVYVPEMNYTGDDTFEGAISDGFRTVTGTITVHMT